MQVQWGWVDGYLELTQLGDVVSDAVNGRQPQPRSRTYDCP